MKKSNKLNVVEENPYYMEVMNNKKRKIEYYAQINKNYKIVNNVIIRKKDKITLSKALELNEVQIIKLADYKPKFKLTKETANFLNEQIMPRMNTYNRAIMQTINYENKHTKELEENNIITKVNTANSYWINPLYINTMYDIKTEIMNIIIETKKTA